MVVSQPNFIEDPSTHLHVYLLCDEIQLKGDCLVVMKCPIRNGR